MRNATLKVSAEYMYMYQERETGETAFSRKRIVLLYKEATYLIHRLKYPDVYQYLYASMG